MFGSNGSNAVIRWNTEMDNIGNKDLANGIETMLEYDTWYNVKIAFDYVNSEVRYYLNGKETAKAQKAPFATSSIGMYRVEDPNSATAENAPLAPAVDDVKLERIYVEKPVNTGTFSVTDTVPETGVIMKDNFEGLTSMSELPVKNGGIYYGGMSADIGNDENNRYIATRWNNVYLAYELCKNTGKVSDIGEGKLAMQYDVRVNKADFKLDAGDVNKLYMTTYPHNGWNEDSKTQRNYFTTVVYDEEQPYVCYSTVANAGGATALNEDGKNKVNITFDEWHTVKTVVDYETSTVSYYVDDKLAHEFEVLGTQFGAFAFDVMQLTRTNTKNDYYVVDGAKKAVTIDIDNLKIERLAAAIDASKPAKIGMVVVNDNLPESGVIMQDDFQSYEDNTKWVSGELSSRVSGNTYPWHYCGGDIVSKGTNKVLQMRWTQSTAYYMGDHIPNAVVDSGKYKVEYKLYVPKMDVGENDSANPEKGNVHMMCIATFKDDDTRSYHEAIVYHPTNPYIVFPGVLNSYVNTSASDEGAVIKNIEHDKWYTVSHVVDFNANKVTYYLDNNEISSYTFPAARRGNVALKDLAFNYVHRINGKEISGSEDNYYTDAEKNQKAVDICIDNVIIERLDVTGETGTAPLLYDRGDEFDASMIEYFTGEDMYDVEFKAPSAKVGSAVRVVVAAYADGKLQGITSEPIAELVKGENSTMVTLGEGFIDCDTIKVFVVEEYSSMRPIVKSTVYTTK